MKMKRRNGQRQGGCGVVLLLTLLFISFLYEHLNTAGKHDKQQKLDLNFYLIYHFLIFYNELLALLNFQTLQTFICFSSLKL